MGVPSASRALPVFGSGEVVRSQAPHWTRSLHHTLSRLLLRDGEISESEYVRVIERMTETLVDNEPLRGPTGS